MYSKLTAACAWRLPVQIWQQRSAEHGAERSRGSDGEPVRRLARGSSQGSRNRPISRNRTVGRSSHARRFVPPRAPTSAPLTPQRRRRPDPALGAPARDQVDPLQVDRIVPAPRLVALLDVHPPLPPRARRRRGHQGLEFQKARPVRQGARKAGLPRRKGGQGRLARHERQCRAR